MAERYAIVWSGEPGTRGEPSEVKRGNWRPTQHAAILDAVDLFWREPGLERIELFCETELVTTVLRNDRRIRATLAALEHAIRDVYEEDSA